MAKVLKEVKPPSQVILGVTGLAKPELLIEIEAFVVLD